MKHSDAHGQARSLSRRSISRGRAGTARRRHAGQEGQALVEFALVLTVFMVVTLGLLDGMRVIFYYSQIQEAAREGARWGSVQVARELNGGTPWGTFADPGNAAGSYCDQPQQRQTCTPLSGSRTLGTGPITNTIVGATTIGTTAVDLGSASITISTTIPPTATEPLQTDDLLTDMPVTVTVSYPFKPILSMVFGGVTINLHGSSTMMHE